MEVAKDKVLAIKMCFNKYWIVQFSSSSAGFDSLWLNLERKSVFTIHL